AEPPLAAASVANIENCFIKSNLDFTTARLRPVGSSAWLGLFLFVQHRDCVFRDECPSDERLPLKHSDRNVVVWNVRRPAIRTSGEKELFVYRLTTCKLHSISRQVWIGRQHR